MRWASCALLVAAATPCWPALPSPSSDFRLYIYDWPQSVTDAWPGEQNYTHHRLSVHRKFRENAGTGPIVSASHGSHVTHQYSLFVTLLARLRESPFLTDDPSRATAFFVPYDIGMDSTTRSSDAALVATGCPRLRSALGLLQQSPYFQRSGGADHVVLHSVSQPMTYFVNKACQEWYEACYDCLKLSIDVFPANMFRQLQTRPAMTHRWVSVPMPSDYHFSADVISVPWQADVDRPRRYAVAFIGSTTVSAKRAAVLRTAISDVCNRNRDLCYLHKLTDHSSNVMASIASETSTLGPYADASLCLMPGGDFPSRKAVLDALLVGCVPVVFQRTTAITQWELHWGGPGVAASVLLHIPMTKFVDDPEVQFRKLLDLAANNSFMTEKRQKIASIGSRMQYRLPGHAERLENRAEQDAADIIVEGLATGAWV